MKIGFCFLAYGDEYVREFLQIATNFPKEYRTMKMVESLGRDYETFKKEYNVYSS